MKIPISKSIFSGEDLKKVLEPLNDGWVVQGPRVAEFESLWSKFIESKYSVATTSCTSALFLALECLDLNPDDEVIVPALSWVSTANIVENVGSKVIFCDIDLQTLNLDINKLNSKITSKTKVIIPVHLFGYPCDIKQIQKVIGDKKIKIIEDAACGFGSYLNNDHVGNHGEFGCFSFHPRKAISTGEGGMIVTSDQNHYKKLLSLRDHGMDYSSKSTATNDPSFMKDHIHAGYNFRMTDIQAALGISQLKRAENILKSREEIAKKYHLSLGDCNQLSIPVVREKNIQHSYQSYVCIFKASLVKEALENHDYGLLLKISEERDRFMQYLANKGIGTRPPTHAIHTLSYYKEKYKIKPEEYPRAWAVNLCGFSLPIFPGLTDEEQNIVINSVSEYLQ